MVAQFQEHFQELGEEPCDGSINRLRDASIHLTAAALALVVAMVGLSELEMSLEGLAWLSLFFVALLVTSQAYWRTQRFPRVADMLGTFASVWLCGILCGLVALGALHRHAPLTDGTLLSIDHAIGVDTIAALRAILHLPQWLISVLIKSYNATVPLLFFCIAAASLFGRRREAWRATFCFSGTLTSVSIISMAFPAKGIAVWLADEDLAQLPAQAARYFWSTFDAYYQGGEKVLSVNAITGVVSFPSFHVIMGLIVVRLWSNCLFVLPFAMLWMIAMTTSTLPLGGHYVADLIGGVAVWSLWFQASRALTGEWSASGGRPVPSIAGVLGQPIRG